MEPILQVRDLEISFLNHNQYIKCTDHVGFNVYPGEILCIVGESGCGKSITALSVLGLLSDQGKVTGGEILFDGIDLRKTSEKTLDSIRGNRISMVFQDVLNSLNPVFTIGNQLTEGIRIHLGLPKAEAREYARNLLAKTGIHDAGSVMRKYPHMLSGGMRQRVMIAMALSCHPALLIADEPTTALDVTIQLQIMQLLKQLQKETGMAIVLITHDIGVVAELADRVVVMYAGQCVEEGSVEQIFAEPSHPYTQALLKAVPGIHDAKNRELFSIPGAVPEHYQDLPGCRFAPRCPYGADCGQSIQRVELDEFHCVCCAKAARERRALHGE